MAKPSKSLSCRVSWKAVLPSLGVEIPCVVVLPQIVRCPICSSEQLHLSDDPTLGSEWAHCRGCRFAGDLIEMAAATWDTEVQAAIAKLDELGICAIPIGDADVIAYMRDHVRYRRRLREAARPGIRTIFSMTCGMIDSSSVKESAK